MKAKLPSGTLLPKNMHFLLQPPMLFMLAIVFLCAQSSLAQTFRTDSLKLKRDSIRKSLKDTVFQLDEVEVSTGYQTLPKERATGSFEVIDEKMLNHNTNTNVIKRLEGITSGTKFFKMSGGILNHAEVIVPLTIRGVTGFQDSNPLIVLDNFPYEGNIEDLNPNDISSVTILRDAAAASIWGARAGNGVIVITTKKGAYQQPTQISLNSNLTVNKKPNLFYLSQMSTSDFIGVERYLYQQGQYEWQLDDTYSYPYVSPVVELLHQQDEGLIDEATATQRIDKLRNLDVRKDYMDYIYRNEVDQQYALDIQGGNERMHYLLSGGYDQNTDNVVTSSRKRYTFRSETTVKPFKHLEIAGGMYYTENSVHDINRTDNDITYGSQTTLPPYTRLVDQQGNWLPTGTRFRTGYLDTVGHGLLKSWEYSPLAEIGKSEMSMKDRNLLLNVAANYQVMPWLKAGMQYQYNYISSQNNRWFGQDSYLMRDWYNTYTTINGDQVNHYFPEGDLLIPQISNFQSHQVRAQLNFNQTFNERHHLDALVAAEIRQNYKLTSEEYLFGYSKDNLSVTYADVVNPQPTFFGYDALLPYLSQLDDETNHFTAILLNGAYSYKNLYAFSFSGRKDASNLYGVKSNQKGSPFWSVGLSWNLYNERFYALHFLSYLKLRLTYGYSGNTRNSVTAIPVINLQAPGSITGLPYATTDNPPNPSLRWERVGTLNAGIDFALLERRISGSLDYYEKRPTDVIASSPVDPSTGFQTLTVNSANLLIKGFDLILNTIQINANSFKWNSNLLFSYNRQIVTNYDYTWRNHSSYLNNGTINPVEGKDAFGMYAYRYAGLDPENGDPIGYLDGALSKDYVALNNSKISTFRYFGSTSPVYFGSFRNTFTFHNLELSINLLFKADYYFRRPSINYNQLFNGSYGHGDFEKRWQVTGDELHTNVPSMTYPGNSYRDDFYRRSEVLVEKGDHIRIQEITLAYTLRPAHGMFKDIQLYSNINNVGIIWRANKFSLDPDLYGGAWTLPVPLSVSFGLRIHF